MSIASALADAVASAHNEGVVHRDLKPANVMLTEEGLVKVLDFGLAKSDPGHAPNSMSQLETLEKTVPGFIVGTVAYMSPEQAEGRAVDYRTDIFSLGVVLYELFARELPFSGETAGAMIASVIKDDPVPLTQRDPQLPRELGKIVHRCLAKDRERRFQSAKDLRNELDELQRELEGGASPDGAIAPPRVAALAGGRRWLAALFLASTVVAGITLWPERALERAPAPVSRWTLSPRDGQRRAAGAWYRSRFAISPDGAVIAYITEEDTEPGRVYLRPLEELDPRPVAGSEGARIVFSRRIVGGSAIKSRTAAFGRCRFRADVRSRSALPRGWTRRCGDRTTS